LVRETGRANRVAVLSRDKTRWWCGKYDKPVKI